MRQTIFWSSLLCLLCSTLYAGDGNRLTYLDELNPYYPHKNFPKLITPQWVGEEGVDCVVVLAIDDMRDPKKYEDYLRPILIRLKQIDGRAPVSIMTCHIDPQDEQLQQWLAEGLSIEIHTVDHPCPLLQGGDFKKAKSTYDRCVDLMNQIPGNKPVAFRMPCCDSLNTVSPRFYAEIFNKTTEKNNTLQISSSVFNIYTSDDPEIPRELVLDADGNERFKKLIPKNLNRKGAVFNTFVNTIENYPYPYVIGNLCWEFPCVIPSDWSAQHYRGKNNPQTLEDFKAALDITVHKKGVFNLVFHPHGWIRNDQIVELIDHAVKKHGKKVKFLTFREALERLNKNLLAGQPIRNKSGRDNGVRILDVNNDGYLDVVSIDPKKMRAIVWLPKNRRWKTIEQPIQILGPSKVPTGENPVDVSFGVFHSKGFPSVIVNEFIEVDGKGAMAGAWYFDAKGWNIEKSLQSQFYGDIIVIPPRDLVYRFRDLDSDGICESLMEVFGKSAKYVEEIKGSRSATIVILDKKKSWKESDFHLPANTSLVTLKGNDAGLRFVDINEDGFDDIVFSNHERYGIWLFKDMQTGWSIEVLAGLRGKQKAAEELPPIVRKDGSNNGFFVHSRHLFWQNEDTAHLTDLVDRRSFDDLLKNIKPAAKSPEMSLRSIEVKPGFTVELVAAEPLVKDPVAFAWGADGKLWVAEMADYPVGNDVATSDTKIARGQWPRGPAAVSPRLGGGRVRFLEDTNGDGQYDKSTLFLDGLNFPNGVMPWKKGVLITAAPDILYAEDTNGDGKADLKIVLFTGFGQGNQQHRANGLAYGLDNWVYCANGDSNGRIKSVGRLTDAVSRSPDRDTSATAGLSNRSGDLRSKSSAGSETRAEPLVTDISGRDFRFNPETGQLDPQSGRTQFGRNRDNWGNWFGCNNSNPHYHFVLADHYLRRNPHIAFPNPMKHVSVTPGAAPCYPVSKAMARFNDYNKLNRFTSACGEIIYRDGLFGKEFAGNSFVSEPVHNLVHREIVTPQGVTFTSRRADDEQTSEFLASRDNWFRPTMLKTGPDGALYIADMYRLVIEHPQYIPKELQKDWNLRAGDDKGRIYRVYPTGTKLRPVPRLDKLSTAELVAALESPSSWQRDTVQRLLVHRRDRAAVSFLEQLATVVNTDREKERQREREKEGRGDTETGRRGEKKFSESPPRPFSPSPRRALARLHALCTLDGLNALKSETINRALSDPHPGVRRHAVRLTESLSKGRRTAEMFDSLLKLVDDPDSHVRMQLAYTLGEWNEKGTGLALGRLLVQAADDRYLTAAAMSSINERNISQTLGHVLHKAGNADSQRQLVRQLLSLATRYGNERTLFVVFSTLTRSDDRRNVSQRFSALAEVLDALERRGKSLDKLRKESDVNLKSQLDRLPAVFDTARIVTKNEKAKEVDRAAAIRLLGRRQEQMKDDLKVLGDLLDPQNSGTLQSAAVQRLGELGRADVPGLLLSRWKTYGPVVRSQVLDTLFSRSAWQRDVVAAIKQRRIDAVELDAARRERLLQHREKTVREQAAKLLAGAINADRRKVLGAYQSALTLNVDAARGRGVFTKTCATCHKLDGVGHEIGPDLAALKDKSPESQLVAILDPNRNVESKYLNYIAVTSEGRSFNGLLTNETGNSITLLAPEGKKHVILRSDLEELTSTAKSTMPEGLEKDLKPQDIADVMAYVASTGEKIRPNGRFPRTIRPKSDGSIELAAANCEIYGPSLVLEKKYHNLGYWESTQDRAIWPIHVPQEREYEIRLTWACPEQTAGNMILFRCGTHRSTAKVQSTGSWDTYREASAGRITLPQGSQRFEVRSMAKLNGFLLDLKSVRLIPIPNKEKR